MLVLALDTTTRAGSAAILRDAVVLSERIGDPQRTHGERLPMELMRVLDEANVRVEEIDLFAVAAGPGSFTGLRVGIATVQGLAMARRRLVVPVSALEALARAGTNAHRPIATWMDAQRAEIFAALYAPDGRDVLIAARSSDPAEWLEAADLREALFIGDGAVRYRDVIRGRVGEGATIVDPPALAGLIGQIAAAEPARAVLPHAVVPIYVRKSDAELARARRAAGK